MQIIKKDVLDVLAIMKAGGNKSKYIHFSNTGVFTHTDNISIFNKHLHLTDSLVGYTISLPDLEKVLKKIKNKEIDIDFEEEACIIKDSNAEYKLLYEDSHIATLKDRVIVEQGYRPFPPEWQEAWEYCTVKEYHNSTGGVVFTGKHACAPSWAYGASKEIVLPIPHNLLFTGQVLPLLKKTKQKFEEYTFLYLGEEPARIVLSNEDYVVSVLLGELYEGGIKYVTDMLSIVFDIPETVLFDIEVPEGLKEAVEGAVLLAGKSKDDLVNRINFCFSPENILVSCEGDTGSFKEELPWEGVYEGEEINCTFSTNKIQEALKDKPQRMLLRREQDEGGNFASILYFKTDNGCKYILGMEE